MVGLGETDEDPRSDARPARARSGHADHRAIPAAFAASLARGALRRSFSIRVLRKGSGRPWAFAMPRSVHWSAPRTTPTGRRTRRESGATHAGDPAAGLRFALVRLVPVVPDADFHDEGVELGDGLHELRIVVLTLHLIFGTSKTSSSWTCMMSSAFSEPHPRSAAPRSSRA